MASKVKFKDQHQSFGQLKISRQKICGGQVLHGCFGDSIPKWLLLQQFPFLKLLQTAHKTLQVGEIKRKGFYYYFILNYFVFILANLIAGIKN